MTQTPGTIPQTEELNAEITRLRARLAAARLESANRLAAIRAALGAGPGKASRTPWHPARPDRGRDHCRRPCERPVISRDPYRHYQRHSRYARRSLRRGGYPVMFIGTGEPLVLIAIAAIGKWAFRHRSAFLPFAVTLADFIIAAILHQHHQPWWIAALLITAITTVITGMPHRVIWAHPTIKCTAGIISRAWQACGMEPGRRTRLHHRRASSMRRLADGSNRRHTRSSKPLPAIATTGTIVLGITVMASP